MSTREVRLFGTILGGAVLSALVYEFNVHSISADIVNALWILPAIVAWHLGQLFLSACAWHVIVGEASISRLAFFRLRIIRESVNYLIPTAQIGGPVIGAIGMAQLGVRKELASAGTIVDVILEAVAQLIFVIVGLLLIPGIILIRPDRLVDVALFLAVGTLLFLLGKRICDGQCAKRALLRGLSLLPDRLKRFAQGVYLEWLELKGRPFSLLKATSLHLLSWCAGAGEVYLVLFAMNVPIDLSHAFAIESVGAVARTAGFAIPGALGFQETGFILIGSQFGLQPDTALALSIIKRFRELLIACIGFTLWRLRRDLYVADQTGSSPTTSG